MNLNWGMIMKTVNEDTAQFFLEGGWGFLRESSDVSISIFLFLAFDETLIYFNGFCLQNEGSDGMSESASEFELDDDETEESSSDDSSQDDDASADEGSEESDEDSGEGVSFFCVCVCVWMCVYIGRFCWGSGYEILTENGILCLQIGMS